MPWKWPKPYPYNLAEWGGVFLALVGTGPLLYQVLGFLGILPTSTSLPFALFFGGIAVAGWALLAFGTRANRRAVPPTAT